MDISDVGERGGMSKDRIFAIWRVSWRIAVAMAITFGIVFMLTRVLGQDKIGWGLMASAWMLAHLGEFKDIAGSSSGVFEGPFFRRIGHYYQNMNYARFWLRLAEWSVAALAGYVISQI